MRGRGHHRLAARRAHRAPRYARRRSRPRHGSSARAPAVPPHPHHHRHAVDLDQRLARQPRRGKARRDDADYLSGHRGNSGQEFRRRTPDGLFSGPKDFECNGTIISSCRRTMMSICAPEFCSTTGLAGAKKTRARAVRRSRDRRQFDEIDGALSGAGAGRVSLLCGLRVRRIRACADATWIGSVRRLRASLRLRRLRWSGG